ncbi:PP-loop family-domain-containing protein [Tricladium varicosporioides]|nr:PP-loop family-domain-containing protein [Hymenoscyphus varicosporioides]
MSAAKNVLHTSTLKTSHLTSTAFISKLSRVLKRHHGPQKKTIGLAISGGVDSMALAVLCSKLKEETKTDAMLRQRILGNSFSKLDFKAFVVDHGVRQGSDVEASAVAKVLIERDIPTQVLKIAWPGSGTPIDMPNFESLARKYRYQTLGRACRDSGITSLLLAHHQDDQAETVLMRLINGHRQLGLRGMKAESAIPECYGIHGIHESGGLGDLHEKTSSSRHDMELAAPNGRLHVEAGGIKIFRPLLDVSKEELIETCLLEEMTWFEDHTNKDPTLTLRNAIRHLYKIYTLPAALTKPTLLGLAKRHEKRISDYQKATRHLLSKCNVQYFDNRSGILSIRFLDINSSTNKSMSAIERRFLATKVLQYCMMLVTPLAQVPTSTLSSAVKQIFPTLDLDYKPEDSTSPVAFNVGGVQFQPHSERSEPQQTSTSQDKTQKEAWLLSRQLPSQAQMKSLNSNLTVTYPPRANIASPKWTPWILYDGRFWIRIKNGTSFPLTLRLVTESDMSQIQSRPHKNSEKLKSIAPGKIRFTLLALVSQDEVVGLPTLGWRISQRFTEVEWEVRYKKVYTEGVEGFEKTL